MVMLYLLRHGIPIDSGDWLGDDASRPLTAAGEAELEVALSTLRDRGELAAQKIFASPLLRAQQTAQIAAGILAAPVETLAALAPGLGPVTLLAVLEKARLPQHLMLVGHNPDLPMLIASLCGGSSFEHTLDRGGLACVEGTTLAPGEMRLAWRTSPRELQNPSVSFTKRGK